MTMLRRFEIYSIAPNAPQAARTRMREAMRECQRFIPEVLHSAVGDNLSAAPVHFAWEHGYASPQDYVAYMGAKFHANILDRYLLPDNPERITTTNGVGVGLAGYSCETPIYLLPKGGARRVVFFDLDPADSSAIESFAAIVRAAPGMTLSVFEENTFAPRWGDAVTMIGVKPQWNYLWEQGFDSLAAAQAYADGPYPLAKAARADWKMPETALVKRSVEVLYALETGWGYGA